MSRIKTKQPLAVDMYGIPVRAIITEGTRADSKEAITLKDGFAAQHLLADHDYDTDEIVEQATNQGIPPVIPPKKNRRVQRNDGKAIYKARHLVKNVFLHLKQWRGIATRYTKNSASFLAAVRIRCIHPWAFVL